jgi:hypothetical protein
MPPYVDLASLERLLKVIESFPNEDDQRRARIAIAPSLARFGQPGRALALARQVNEAPARAYFDAQTALARAQLGQQVSVALDELLKLRPSAWQFNGLATIRLLYLAASELLVFHAELAHSHMM